MDSSGKETLATDNTSPAEKKRVFQCDNCGRVVESIERPDSQNCPQGKFHKWDDLTERKEDDITLRGRLVKGLNWISKASAYAGTFFLGLGIYEMRLYFFMKWNNLLFVSCGCFGASLILWAAVYILDRRKQRPWKKKHRFLCKKCGRMDYEYAHPEVEGCPNGDDHIWTDVDKLHWELRLLYGFMIASFFISVFFCWSGLIRVLQTDRLQTDMFMKWNYLLSLSCAFLAMSFILWWLAKKREHKGDDKPIYPRAVIVIAVGVVLLLSAVLIYIYREHRIQMDAEEIKSLIREATKDLARERDIKKVVEGFLNVKRPVLYKFLELAYHLLRDVGLGMITAGVIAIIIEAQNFMEFVSKAVTKSLTRDEYLKELPEERLESLKRSCSKQIMEINHNRKDLNLNETLLDFETAVSKQIFMPYYEFMRINVVYKEVTPDEIPKVKVKVKDEQGKEQEKEIPRFVALGGRLAHSPHFSSIL